MSDTFKGWRQPVKLRPTHLNHPFFNHSGDHTLAGQRRPRKTDYPAHTWRPVAVSRCGQAAERHRICRKPTGQPRPTRGSRLWRLYRRDSGTADGHSRLPDPDWRTHCRVQHAGGDSTGPWPSTAHSEQQWRLVAGTSGVLPVYRLCGDLPRAREIQTQELTLKREWSEPAGPRSRPPPGFGHPPDRKSVV